MQQPLVVRLKTTSIQNVVRSNHAQAPSRGHLGLKEKLAVTATLLFLSLVAASSYARKINNHHLIEKTIHVYYAGACAEKGTIEMPSGSQIQDLLARLKLAPEADTSKLVLHDRLKDKQLVIIPQKGKISLYIDGAVKEPGIIVVPEGLHFNELMPYLSLSNDADIGVIRRRRRQLSEGETIHIPAKSEFIVRK